MNEEVVVLGRIIDAIGSDVRVVSVQGGPHSLVEADVNFLGSGYQQKLIEYPLFDLRFFTRSSLVMPELVDVVANNVGVWPLIVSYLKETGRGAIVLWYDLPLSILLPLFCTHAYRIFDV